MGKLKLYYQYSDIDKNRLYSVYEESITKSATREGTDIVQARWKFFDYLQRDFFSDPRSMIAVWEKDSEYVSILRLEAFQDGFLITGLETSPNHRRLGYAYELISASLAFLQGEKNVPVYSHILQSNLGSVAVHVKCGFQKQLNYAKLLDETVSSRFHTYCFWP